MRKFKEYPEGSLEREVARQQKTYRGHNYNDGKYPNPYMSEWTKKDKETAIWWVCWFIFFGSLAVIGA